MDDLYAPKGSFFQSYILSIPTYLGGLFPLLVYIFYFCN